MMLNKPLVILVKKQRWDQLDTQGFKITDETDKGAFPKVTGIEMM